MDGVDLYPDALRTLGGDVNQTYGNMQAPPGVAAGSAIGATIPESMQLSSAALAAAGNVPDFINKFTGTMGYVANGCMRSADMFHEMDANAGARYDEINGQIRSGIQHMPATGSSGGPHHHTPPPDGTTYLAPGEDFAPSLDGGSGGLPAI